MSVQVVQHFQTSSTMMRVLTMRAWTSIRKHSLKSTSLTQRSQALALSSQSWEHLWLVRVCHTEWDTEAEWALAT